MEDRIPMAWDMETSDPDDAFTLCLLATHPAVNLVAVTVHPGSPHQIGVVRHLLHRLDRNDIPVGAANPAHNKECVSHFHYKWLGKTEPSKAEESWQTLLRAYWDHKNKMKIVTGAALTNVKHLLDKANVFLDEIVMQGGFAGDSVVPEEFRMEKFQGRETYPTFNLNGNIEAAKEVISTTAFKLKRFVSKNVCHSIIYNEEMHERIRPYRYNNAGLALLVEGMDLYLQKRRSGKAFHDPLAACVAIEPNCCEFREVEIYRERGEWGSHLKEGSGTWISVRCDREKFERILVGKT